MVEAFQGTRAPAGGRIGGDGGIGGGAGDVTVSEAFGRATAYLYSACLESRDLVQNNATEAHAPSAAQDNFTAGGTAAISRWRFRKSITTPEQREVAILTPRRHYHSIKLPQTQ